MKKRVISLILVLAMLLCAVPAVAAEEVSVQAPKFTTRSLTLNKSIAINFKVPYSDVENNFTKVVFIYDDEEIQTIHTLPAADTKGMAVFSCTELSPLDLAKEITARLYDKNGEYTEAKTSVLEYCNYVLNSPNESAELKTLVVDLLNYGAAFQTYKGITSGLANETLTEEQKALGTQTDPQLTSILEMGTELTDPAVAWTAAGLVLEDSVTVSFKIRAASVDGLTMKVTCKGSTWEIKDFGASDSEGIYKIYFDKLNPAQMRDKIEAVVYDAQGNAVSNKLTYSIESYAAYQEEQSADANLVALVKAMLRYGDATDVWANGKTEAEAITRADMEAALAEVAWDYYMKDVWYQYDSVDLNTRSDGFDKPMSRWIGGFTRLSNYLDALEDSTAHDTLYTVCSYLPWAVYYEALDYPLFGNSLNSSTLNFWYYAEKPQDMCVIRYHSWAEDTNIESHEEGYVTHDKCVTYEELCSFISNWEENLRPGDIFYVIGGHSALYVGNGWIIEGAGQKYNLTLGTDQLESNGSFKAWTIEDYFFNENSGTTYFLSRLIKEEDTRLCILRPLDLLTVDDGDDDPDNDVLNEAYELDIGRLKFQFSNDPNNILKKSGYTIQDSAYSRMKYPAMNINRTVNITPYGTAVQGDTITYTVEIANESNNTNYVKYHSVDAATPYTGQAYEDLSIVETIPANTVLVSAEGASVDGNTLRWALDVPVGAKVSVSYTVRVTGQIGDQIVNGGGWVDNIPSNTITNTIGGAKLDSDALAGMSELYSKDTAYWNSNDGYRISAATDAGTGFAERIYNEATGLDLQLPDIQDLMDLMFTQTLVTEDYGMYLRYANTPTSRYMYRLNETTANAEDQIYRDMLVEGYYGGVWVYTNVYAGEPRTDELRTDYLEAGDILVYMNLDASASEGAASEDRKVASWQVLVYLGNNQFASLKSSGKMQKLAGVQATGTAFNFDVYLALRPSQVYGDLNVDVAEYQGPAADLTEKDAQLVYTPNISNVLLNEKLSAKLAAMTPEDGWTYVNMAFASQVYTKLGIERPASGYYETYATWMKNLFIDDPESTTLGFAVYGHAYTLMEEPTEQNVKMYESLLYYGGPTFLEPKPVTSLADLHPGDILLLGLRNERYYVGAVYQGNGKFLTGTQNLRGGIYYTGVESYWGSLSFENDEQFLAYLSGTIDATVSNLGFEGYLVIRPSRVYENINLVLRDIEEAPLTEAEKNALAALTPEALVGYGNLQSAGVQMYKLAYVNVAPYFNMSVHNMLQNLFTAPSGKYERKAETNDYQTMLVDNSWGGNDFAQQNQLTVQQLRIGDVLCGRFKDNGENVYWTALYQGNGNFLAQQNHNSAGGSAFVVALEKLDTYPWDYYYVLRPENLANTGSEEPGEGPGEEPGGEPEEPVTRDIATGKLTDTEKAALAAITPANWESANKPANLNGAGVWMYNAAGIDLSSYLLKSVNATKEAIFYVNTSASNKLFLREITEDNQNYMTMLVEDSWSGSHFLEADRNALTANMLQIGDLVCGQYKTGGKTMFWTALYQGEGNFLVQEKNNTDKTDSCFTKTLEELTANSWDYRYVLRPDNLATAAPEEPGEGPGEEPDEPVVILRDIATELLTDAEKAALAALTPADWTAANKPANLNGAGVWMYKAAGIDLSSYLTQSVNATRTAVMYDSLNFKEITADNLNYNIMLLDNTKGGTWDQDNVATTIIADMLQIGDLFCGQYKTGDNKTMFWTALYQGEGNFLVQEKNNTDKTDSCFTKTLEEVMANNWNYRYVLRPQNLAPQPLRKIADAPLSRVEKYKLSQLTAASLVEKYQYYAIREMYRVVGIDVTDHIKTDTVNTVKTTIFTNAGALKSTTSDYKKMLLADSYGGTEFGATAQHAITAELLEIGDTFWGKFVSGGNKYWTALYQGNSQFLVAEGSAHSVKTLAELMAIEWSYYYVLRPDQLANQA